MFARKTAIKVESTVDTMRRSVFLKKYTTHHRLLFVTAIPASAASVRADTMLLVFLVPIDGPSVSHAKDSVTGTAHCSDCNMAWTHSVTQYGHDRRLDLT